MTVTLSTDEWNKVLAILSQAPWREANPLIMAIGGQLQAAQSSAASAPTTGPFGETGRPNGADRNP